jgi:Activator of Hsp90 ATPase homolog 1-like protein
VNLISAIDPIRKSITVDASQRLAFETFTERIGSWWPKDRGIGTPLLKDVQIEPRLGGRVYQICEDDAQVTWGTVLVWEPYGRFTFTWQIDSNWNPLKNADANMHSEVAVRFIPQGSQKTRIELEHGHFERMGVDPGRSMRNDVAWGWPQLLHEFQQTLTLLT